MSEFAGTAKYYREFRPGIPDSVTDLLVTAANRDAEATTLLDLGTGTGQVVRGLHPHFREIIAVDPDESLLDFADEDMRPALGPHTRLRLVHAAAEDFQVPAGWSASLVTICRAFHWMDQPLVLQRLADIVPETGVVAVFADSSFWAADNAWKRAVRAVVQSFLGEERRAGNGTFSHHNRPYSEILAESAFSDVEEVIVPIRRTWTSETILGYLYSTSFAARPLFGGRINEFETAIRTTLSAHSDDDTYTEDNEFVIRLGRKRHGC